MQPRQKKNHVILDIITWIRDQKLEIIHKTQLKEYTDLRIEELGRKVAKIEAQISLSVNQQRDAYGNLRFPTIDLQRAEVVSALARDRNATKYLKLLSARKRRIIKLASEIESNRAYLDYNQEWLALEKINLNHQKIRKEKR